MCRGMVFWRYPLDQHVCSFRLSSCEYYIKILFFHLYLSLLSVGYDLSQIKIYGQYSYQRSSQRDLQFATDIREIDLSRRVWHGEESEFIVLASVQIMASCFRKLQHVWCRDFDDQILHSLHIFCLHSHRCPGHLQLGRN